MAALMASGLKQQRAAVRFIHDVAAAANELAIVTAAASGESKLIQVEPDECSCGVCQNII